MLRKEHIDWYWEDIMAARRHAFNDIQTARMFAYEMECQGCEYCNYLLWHEAVLGQTTMDLILTVDSLLPEMRTKRCFPRTFTHNTAVYRGFIADNGDYLCVTGDSDHDKAWEEYANEHGKNRAYRLIKVTDSCGTSQKARVIFSDRKTPPSKEQYKTLKELMIEAEGELCFRFFYDPTHPH